MNRLLAICVAMLAASACSQPEDPMKACTPPRANWVKPHCLGCGLEVPGITIQIDRDSKLYEDGRPIDYATMVDRLRMAGKLDNPAISVRLETEMGADCGMVERVRNDFEKYLSCGEYGQCAEGNEQIWRRISLPPGTPPS